MARAGNQHSVTSTSGETIYSVQADSPAGTIRVNCHSQSAVSVLVNAVGPQGTGVWEELEPGKSGYYRGVEALIVKVSSGTATIGWAVATRD